MVITVNGTLKNFGKRVEEHCNEFERLLKEGQVTEFEWELGYLQALDDNGFGFFEIFGGIELSELVENYVRAEEEYMGGDYEAAMIWIS